MDLYFGSPNILSVLTKKCPLCGASVNVENLRRHVAQVHPGKDVGPLLSETEERSVRRRTSRPRRTVSRRMAAAIALLVLLAIGAAVALPRLAPSGSMHIHPQLSITIAGQVRTVPVNIGIDPALWNDHSLDGYSMESMAPLHTHDASGQIHVESTVTRDYTLGEFFRTWGQSFDASQVLGHPAGAGHRVWMVVDGTEMEPTYSVVFRDRMRIQIFCEPA